jgi:hypothetical protein
MSQEPRRFSLARNGTIVPELHEEDKKGAAVSGGSKVITGRRQTEWTGATRRYQ